MYEYLCNIILIIPLDALQQFWKGVRQLCATVFAQEPHQLFFLLMQLIQGVFFADLT